MPRNGWNIVYWVLLSAFVLTAALNLLHEKAGLLTSHLADLAVPALLYVLSRGLVPNRRIPVALRWIGRTPTRAAVALFLASAATEVSQLYWPSGIFSGRFDPWDLAAFAAGLLLVWIPDAARARQTTVA